ncbi:Rieske 2Fe-2S domain-containing protein [Paraburkholderia sp. USG1]|uniref:Rieske 2Fe-2S domain-containing protein n=1 Tax=Paraburkholderia sp. USG1 TaxID=2952268 RepID=UPI00285D047B|nr:Rieske 2Fe-2S domain-containing protein [Paraburkholderia sp. USG1]MDR8398323.1 Rieske 2Fe-2S domain-containing protein [Paraburkholderia sp. USG1]
MNCRTRQDDWVPVCNLGELDPGTMRPIDIDGLPPIALFNVAGTVHATSNICTHNVAMLTDGTFCDHVVECPLHGGSFDVTTGEAISYPCEVALQTFDVQVKNGTVLVAKVAADAGSAAARDTRSEPDGTAAATTGAGEPCVVRMADSELSYTNAPGDTLLRAALRSGIGFPYECNSGGCGSCMYELASGEVIDRMPDAAGLSARARAAGKRLACQSVPQSDCVIRIRRLEEYVPPIVPRRQRLELERVTRLTRDMSEFRFRGEGPAEFLPGQYAMLGIEGTHEERAYSMSNTANREGIWEFIVKRVPEGRFSPRLFGIETTPAVRVTLDGPYGTAYLRPESPRPILCIAGGAGLSPMMSILRGASRTPGLAGRETHLFYGGRTPQDLCDAALLAADDALRGKIINVSAVSDSSSITDEGWSGERGFIHEVLEARLGKRFAEFEIYLSGPPAMVDAVQRMLVVGHRVPVSQIHFDRFC